MTAGVVAVDIGGSGSRALWRALDGSETVSIDGSRVSVTSTGTSMARSVRAILGALDQRIGSEKRRGTRVVCIGATGLLGLTPDREAVRLAAHEVFSVAPVLLASDAVCAATGALGGQPGVVIAAGTGAIALGTDLEEIWHRVDGWGHVFGDLGSGSWIGRTALSVAAEHYDGRRTDAAALLDAATAELGPAPGWPAVIYTSDQRAGILASLVPRVVELASEGDPVAAEVCREAGRLLARTIAAALVDGVPPVASWTGALLREAEPVRAAFRNELERLRPEVELRDPVGSVVDGAVHLAAAFAKTGTVPAVARTPLASWYSAPYREDQP